MQNFKSFENSQHGPFSLQNLPQNAIFGPGTYLTYLNFLPLHWKIVIMLSQYPLAFCQTCSGMPHLMTILMLIGMVFVIIWDLFYGRMCSNSVLLLLLVNFVSGFRLESMYISLIISIKSSLTHLLGFQLLVLLP